MKEEVSDDVTPQENEPHEERMLLRETDVGTDSESSDSDDDIIWVDDAMEPSTSNNNNISQEQRKPDVKYSCKPDQNNPRKVESTSENINETMQSTEGVAIGTGLVHNERLLSPTVGEEAPVRLNPQLIGGRFKCDLCDQGFVNRTARLNHRRHVHFEPPVQSQVYEPAIVSLKQNAETVVQRLIESLPPHEDLPSTSRAAVQVDEPNVPRPATNKTWSCRYCGKVCLSYNSRYQHEKIKHSEKTLEKKLMREAMREDRRNGLGYTCRFCGKISKSYQTNYAHEKSAHGAHKNHRKVPEGTAAGNNAMDTSGNTSTTLVDLETETLIRKHPKKIRCPVCTEKFEERYLKVHMKKHSNERPFVCPQCGQTFKQTNHLNKHLTACKVRAGSRPGDDDVTNFAHLLPTNDLNDNTLVMVPGPSVVVKEDTSSNHAMTGSELGSQEEIISPFSHRSRGNSMEPGTSGQNNAPRNINEGEPFGNSNNANIPNFNRENIPARLPDDQKRAPSLVVATSASDGEDNVHGPAREEDVQNLNSRKRRHSPAAAGSLHQNIVREFDPPLTEGICETETTPMPLSVVIYSRVRENPDEMFVVYLNDLDSDAVSASTAFSDRCILVVQNLNLLKQADICQFLRNSNPQMVTASIQVTNNTLSTWSVITFDGRPLPVELNNRLLTNMLEMENILVQHAQTRQMRVINLMRYSRDGLYQNLTRRLSVKTIGCNFAP